MIGSNQALDTEVSGIAYDSRAVKPGDVFVCIKGYQTDGHKYAADAAAKGAAAIVACDTLNMSGVAVLYTPDTRLALAQMSKTFFGDPLKNIKLIGITGTNGKTTVTYLIKAILEAAGKTVGLIGTNQNMIGETVLPTERTTPESFELYQIFRQMADAGAEYVVMEVVRAMRSNCTASADANLRCRVYEFDAGPSRFSRYNGELFRGET